MAIAKVVSREHQELLKSWLEGVIWKDVDHWTADREARRKVEEYGNVVERDLELFLRRRESAEELFRDK